MPSQEILAESEQDARIQWNKTYPVKLIDSIQEIKKGKPSKNFGFPRKTRNRYHVTWHYKKSEKYSF